MVDETPTSRPVRLLLTPEEAARALGVSRAKLYPMLMRRQIASIRIGGSRRIPLSALQQYVEDRLGTTGGYKRQWHTVQQHEEE
jgi:excisionase family DNA binding protein